MNLPGNVESKNAVQAIQGRYPVGLGHRRIVERGVDEILETVGLAFLRHDRLTDVHNLSRLLTKAVYTENLESLCMK